MHTNHYLDKPDAAETKHRNLILEVLHNVKARIKGALPENEAPDFVKPCTKTDNGELHTYLDYDQGISLHPESGTESDEERQAQV